MSYPNSRPAKPADNRTLILRVMPSFGDKAAVQYKGAGDDAYAELSVRTIGGNLEGIESITVKGDRTKYDGPVLVCDAMAKLRVYQPHMQVARAAGLLTEGALIVARLGVDINGQYINLKVGESHDLTGIPGDFPQLLAQLRGLVGQDNGADMDAEDVTQAISQPVRGDHHLARERREYPGAQAQQAGSQAMTVEEAQRFGFR